MNTTLSPLGDLGKLPPELRNMIYNFALTTDNPVEILRFRRLRTDHVQRLDKAVTHVTNVYEYGPKSKILTWRGKQKRRSPAITVLALNLLLASKTVRGEALPILYGANTFKFDTVWAVKAFLVLIGNCALLLKDIDLPVAEAFAANENLSILERLSDPTRIVVRVPTEGGSAYFAAITVRWAIRDYVQRHEYYGYRTGSRILERFQLDAQMRRFDRMEFKIDEGCQFGGQGDGEPYTMKDPVERARRFKEMVREMFTKEAKEQAAREKERASKVKGAL